MSEQNIAAVLHGIDDLRIESVPIPSPQPHELLIRIHTVGICGSDVHYWTHGRIGNFIVEKPMIVGHESSGVVAGVGSSVQGFKVGDRIAMEPGVPCKGCEQCKTGRYNLCPSMRFFATPPVDGVIARYATHDASFCYKLPDNVSFEEGALLEPLSVAVHSCQRANLRMGQRVLVLGAGPIGILNVLTAKASGAGRVIVTDLDDGRLALAKKLGADVVVNVRGKSLTDVRQEIIDGLGSEPQVSIECTGAASSIETAITTTQSGGVIVLVGLGATRNDLPIIESATREVDIRGIFRYVNCYPTALELISSGRLDLSGLSRAHYKIEDTVEAFKRTQKADVIKVFIEC